MPGTESGIGVDWESSDGACRVLVGNCRERMKELAENSVDAIVTDPPAGIAFMNKEFDDFRRARNPSDSGRENVFGRTSKTGPEYGRGVRENFIEWLQAIAEECLRVAKPGAHALVWAIPRTSHWTATAWENAGWVCRDRITHLTGQGFPKGLDIRMAIDREAGLERERIRGVRSGVTKGTYAQDAWSQEFKDSILSQEPISDDAKQWDGWNVALKPAAEDWWLFRKPLDGTVAQNILKWGVGGLNIGACRIGTGADKAKPGACGLFSHIRDGKDFPGSDRLTSDQRYAAVVGDEIARVKLANGRQGEESAERRYDDNGGTSFAATPGPRGGSPMGRWPANVLLQHHEACRLVGTKQVSRSLRESTGDLPPVATYGSGLHGSRSLGETTEEVEAWECHPECPCAMFPETASGKPSGRRMARSGESGIYGSDECRAGSELTGFGDAGSASRFFYQAKASRQGRWFFCRDCQSAHCETDRAAHAHGHLNEAGKQDWSHIVAHPTVKPCGDGKRGEPGYRDSLMNYLCRLVTPPNGLILDPFGGTGSTGVAALQEHFRVIVCEQDPEYAEIIKARVNFQESKKSSQSTSIPKSPPANKVATKQPVGKFLFPMESE